MSLGVDYSGGRPGGAALKAAGISFAMRYIAHPRGAYNLTSGEIADLRANDIAIGLICERGASRVLGGAAAGKADATLVRSWLGALGVPSDRPVYFAIDFDTSASDYTPIAAYLKAAADVLTIERVGAYGEYDVLVYLERNSLVSWYWQTRAWSHGLVAKFAHIYQYETGSTGAKPINGAAVDYDRSQFADFGQWPVLPDSSIGGDMAWFPIRIPGGARAGKLAIPSGTDLFRVADGAQSSAPNALTDTAATSAIHDVDGGSPGFVFTDAAGITYWVRASDVGFTESVDQDAVKAAIAAAVAKEHEANRDAALKAVGEAIP